MTIFQCLRRFVNLIIDFTHMYSKESPSMNVQTLKPHSSWYQEGKLEPWTTMDHGYEKNAAFR